MKGDHAADAILRERERITGRTPADRVWETAQGLADSSRRIAKIKARWRKRPWWKRWQPKR